MKNKKHAIDIVCVIHLRQLKLHYLEIYIYVPPEQPRHFHVFKD